MSNSIPDEVKNKIEDAIFSGRKIEAIKLLREASGLGLAEAKTSIESLASELREKSPERFTSQTSGCGSAALLLLAFACSVAYFAYSLVP